MLSLESILLSMPYILVLAVGFNPNLLQDSDATNMFNHARPLTAARHIAIVVPGTCAHPIKQLKWARPGHLRALETLTLP